MTTIRPTRRGLLVATAIVALLAACSPTEDASSTAEPASTTTAPATDPTTTTSPPAPTTEAPGCGAALREIARRDIAGTFDWGDEDAEELEELTEAEFDAFLERHEVDPVPFPSGVADPDGPRSTLPGQPDALATGQLDDASLRASVEACWDSGLLSEEDEERIWDEIWAELEAAE